MSTSFYLYSSIVYCNFSQTQHEIGRLKKIAKTAKNCTEASSLSSSQTSTDVIDLRL